MIVVDTKGATDCWKLYRLLLREKKYGSEFDPIDEPETDYYCDNDIYNVCFIPPSTSSAYYCLMQHICLILTYNASSRDSWDEVVAACERIRNRCKDAVLPFLTIMIAAIDEGETSVSHAEAEAFATQRDYLFIKFSPTTGRGICDTVGLKDMIPTAAKT
ncbi:hypothetical protein N7499_006329 [Penicillium canescens]|nr:hypothetical protein N7499_006329 [Penicillium canescens]